MELYSIGVHLLYLIFHSFIFGFTLCDIWVKIQINILQLVFALLQIKRNYDKSNQKIYSEMLHSR